MARPEDRLEYHETLLAAYQTASVDEPANNRTI